MIVGPQTPPGGLSNVLLEPSPTLYPSPAQFPNGMPGGFQEAVSGAIFNEATGPYAVRVAKLSAWLDGGAGGTGTQAVRGVIYSTAGEPLMVGDEVLIPAGMEEAVVDFTFPSMPVILEPFAYGLLVDSANIVRVRVDPSLSGTAYSAGLTYGATPGTATLSVETGQYGVFATLTPLYVPPEETEFYYGGLPWADAQNVFSAGTIARDMRVLECGWHGAGFDAQVGAFALVSQSGPNTDLVGERLRLTYRGSGLDRAVYVYCHSMADIAEDISLTRRAFVALTYLALDEIETIVEVVS